MVYVGCERLLIRAGADGIFAARKVSLVLLKMVEL